MRRRRSSSHWALTKGQPQALSLDYVPLPAPLGSAHRQVHGRESQISVKSTLKWTVRIHAFRPHRFARSQRSELNWPFHPLDDNHTISRDNPDWLSPRDKEEHGIAHNCAASGRSHAGSRNSPEMPTTADRSGSAQASARSRTAANPNGIRAAGAAVPNREASGPSIGPKP